MAEGDSCDQPKFKKQKTEKNRIHPIFKEFYFNDGKRKALLAAFNAVNDGLSGMILGFLHVDSSNATSDVCFTDATIEYTALDMTPTLLDGATGFPVGEVFLTGLDVLRSYLTTGRPKVPTHDMDRKALEHLLIFLSSEKDHKILFEERDTDSEAKWSVTLAQHLLCKLAVNSTYTIDSSTEIRMQDVEPVCQCSEKDKLIGKVGDTSYGSSKGWHGQTDIIMEDQISVSVFPKGSRHDFEDDSGDESEERSVSSVEVKNTTKFNERIMRQIISQTIVFSFLQRKLNLSKLNNFLIPGIGINTKSILVCFFDTEHDVLLESFPVEIFSSKAINYIAIVFLWLTLNYRLFCSGLSDVLKVYKADFIRALGDHADIYLDNVAIPMHKTQRRQARLFPFSNLPKKDENRASVDRSYSDILDDDCQ